VNQPLHKASFRFGFISNNYEVGNGLSALHIFASLADGEKAEVSSMPVPPKLPDVWQIPSSAQV